jgi:cytochrome d ubiquinol oxidase subunit I
MGLQLARWQFAFVTIFHFFLVPVTIGLGLLVAVMQTLAYRRHDAGWDRLTRFFGRMFLINLATGVVSGIVLEFEFGLNWSNYSAFVGNIFGAPLALEALIAFFLESTFVGLWIFGRERLSPRVHLTTIWLTSVGTILSAYFILVANAWMQHPVGYKVEGGQAVLTDFWAVLGNSTALWSFAHTILAAVSTGAALMLGVSVWRAYRDRGVAERSSLFYRAARFAAAFMLVAVILTAVSGDMQARLMDTQQPMKMASAEALYNTSSGASFSIITIGTLNGSRPVFQIRVPHLLSLIADLSWDGQVQGINQVQAAEAAKYGAGSYTPVTWVTYWSFRLMVGAGIAMIGLGAWALWGMRRRHFLGNKWFRRAATFGIALPFLANSTGWIFTEVGRQPWVVYGLLKTSQGVSPVPTADVVFSLVMFVAVYAVIFSADAALMVRAARRELDDVPSVTPAPPGDAPDEAARVPSLIY